MSTFFDRLAATAVLFLGAFAAATYLIGNFVYGLIIALFLAFIFNLAVSLARSKKIDKKCTPHQLFDHFLHEDNAADYIKKLLPPDTPVKTENNKLCIESGEKIIFLDYKLGATIAGDVIKFAKAAKAENAKIIYIVSGNIDAHALSFAATYENLRFIFISHKKVYAALKNKNLLPQIGKSAKKSRPKLKDALSRAFARRNFKHFLFSGVLLTASSFLVLALKTYYLVFGIICLLCALICLIPKTYAAQKNKPDLFDDA